MTKKLKLPQENPYGKRGLLIFCGASDGNDPLHKIAMEEFVQKVAQQGVFDHVIYGGGRRGVMGELAKACALNNLPLVGVIPQFLADYEQPPETLAACYVVQTMHERLALMAGLAGAAVAFSGGVGTLREMLDFLDNSLIHGYGVDHASIRALPQVVVNLDGLFDGLGNLLSCLVAAGFADNALLVKNLAIVDNTDAALGFLADKVQPQAAAAE